MPFAGSVRAQFVCCHYFPGCQRREGRGFHAKGREGREGAGPADGIGRSPGRGLHGPPQRTSREDCSVTRCGEAVGVLAEALEAVFGAGELPGLVGDDGVELGAKKGEIGAGGEEGSQSIGVGKSE